MPRIEGLGELDWDGLPFVRDASAIPRSSTLDFLIDLVSELKERGDFAIEYHAGDKWYDLKFFIMLDKMPDSFSENREFGAYYPSNGFDGSEDMDTGEKFTEDQCDLPRELKYAFKQIAFTFGNNSPDVNEPGTAVHYFWNKKEAGRKIDINITRYPDPVRYPTRFIEALARKMSAWVKEAPTN